MRFWLTLAPAIILSSCGGEKEGETPSPGPDRWPVTDSSPKWQNAPEDSFVLDDIGESEFSDYIVRCWKIGEKYSCLRANTLKSSNSSSIYFDFNVFTQLPKNLYYNNKNGFSCEYGDSFGNQLTEIIRDNSVTIDSNTTFLSGQFPSYPWNKIYVERFLQENSIEGIYFNCFPLVNVFRSGSLASFKTTKISYDQIVL